MLFPLRESLEKFILQTLVLEKMITNKLTENVKLVMMWPHFSAVWFRSCVVGIERGGSSRGVGR